MADILNIGLTALLAQQRALATASNNIANANTPGYTRQRVELLERPSERIGSSFIGTGVNVGHIRRIGDEILAEQLRSASAEFHRSDMFAGLATILDNLLADQRTGLNATLQSFVNSLQGVADDPASIPARQVFLSEARSLVSRFDDIDRRLNEVSGEVNARIGAAVTEINALGAGIAEVNRQILTAGAPSDGSPPADLLDQRDRLLERLSELVRVDTAPQRDGTLSVFIGSGQSLVLGVAATELTVIAGTFDPAQPEIALAGPGVNVVVTRFISGGELGGALDFRRDMVTPARASLGRIAVGLAEVFNSIHNDGMDLEGALGGDLFAVPGPRVFDASSNTGSGSASATIADVSGLQATNYQLAFDGAGYTLFRSDSNTAVPMTGSGTALDPFLADGLSIVVGGAPAAGDRHSIRPVADVPGDMRILISQPEMIAAAAPTRTRAVLANAGNGTISAGQVVDVGDAGLLTTATVEFLDAATYSINGAGAFAYTPGADIDINGTRAQISGAPAAGDQFVIESNVGGVGDNRNALGLIAGLAAGVLDGGTATLQASVSRLVSDIGAQTAETMNRRDAQRLLLDQSRQGLDSVRGVNLDEEAADLLRFEQLYQAAAQTISVADSLFAALLDAVRR